MKYIADKIYIETKQYKLDEALLILVVSSYSEYLKKTVDGKVLYCEFNIDTETLEVENLEYTVDDFDNKKFIKGFELQKILDLHS